MSIFYDRAVNILGHNAIVIKKLERGMRKIDSTSNADLYKKNGKVFVKFR